MLIKEKDKNQEQVNYLTDLLERELPAEKKRFIERELKCLYSGDKGEKTPAYYLDFDFKDSKNWALIHDLRFEHNGDVAQIDHLLIGRMMDVYVIETKNFSAGVSISDEGDFSYSYNNSPCHISSPIAQNERQIKLLDRFLSDNKLYPKRLGVPLKPNYKNIVLISPEARLTKPNKGLFDCSAVMKSDKFANYFKDDIDSDDTLNSMVSIAKVISTDSLRSFAESLAFYHEPLTTDYNKTFGIVIDDVSKVSSIVDDDSMPLCPTCGGEMVKRVVKKGKNAGKEFWGCKSYPKCKGSVELAASDIVEKKKDEPEDIIENVPECPECEKPMVRRVAKKGDKKGNAFWGCVDFPKCKGTLKIKDSEMLEKSVIKTDSKDVESPLCPKCNEPMVKRSAKKGDAAGTEFWGCSQFPKCRGIVSIEK